MHNFSLIVGGLVPKFSWYPPQIVRILTLLKMVSFIFIPNSFFFILFHLRPSTQAPFQVVFLLFPIWNTTPLSSEPIAQRHASLKSLSCVDLSPWTYCVLDFLAHLFSSSQALDHYYFRPHCKKNNQLPAVDMQHAPAKLPSKLHLFHV